MQVLHGLEGEENTNTCDDILPHVQNHKQSNELQRNVSGQNNSFSVNTGDGCNVIKQSTQNSNCSVVVSPPSSRLSSDIQNENDEKVKHDFMNNGLLH